MQHRTPDHRLQRLASLLVAAMVAVVTPWLPAQPQQQPAGTGQAERAGAQVAERAFHALEREMYAKHQSRIAGAGGRLDRVERAHLEQGRELVERWTAFLNDYPADRALAFRARNYLVQGYHLSARTEDALRLLKQMEAEARSVEEILSVAMGSFHARDSMEAGAQVLDRYVARQKDPEAIATATLEKRRFASGRNRAIRNEKRLEIARQVAQAYPQTAAGRRAALLARAGELAPGHRPLDMAAFRDVRGKPIALADYRGKALLIHFWGASFGECVRELPALVEAYRACHERGFEVLSVSLDRDRTLAEGTARHHGLTWRHHCDGRGWGNEIAILYQVNTLPYSILIGADGRVAALNPAPKALKGLIEKVLPKQPDAPRRREPDTPARSDPR